MLIFEKSVPARYAHAQLPEGSALVSEIPSHLLRKSPAKLPEVSELQVIRHFTVLSQKNFSIDSNFYPLGSCTMKYNPRVAQQIGLNPDFISRHPLASIECSQGFMQCVFETQELLKQITGMNAISLTPMAGAQGEFAGIAMIKAYHKSLGDFTRTEILVPDSAHGTNPASAIMCGYKVKEIPTDKNGDLDLECLQRAVSEKTAGMMLTNPSTLGVFESNIQKIADIIHNAGGLLYYDGANLNAILGQVRPVDMGFDVMHINLHKTFATPHGGGGPGCGPVAANNKLAEFLPIPMVGKKGEKYIWLTKEDCVNSIGRLSTFMGNAGIILRAYVYLRILGRQGLRRVSEIAVLNANYLMKKLSDIGFDIPFANRRAAHEFIITLKQQAKDNDLTALDFAKRILDEGIHAPTIYFPLSIPECWLIEPTETDTKEVLDTFIEQMQKSLLEAQKFPDNLRKSPQNLPITRLDEVKAAREINTIWRD
jgi:glycine dehydrogenase subunit 2